MIGAALPPRERVLLIRDRLAAALELPPLHDRQAIAERRWRALPKWFRERALMLARCGKERECMPLDTFDRWERVQLEEAARHLASLADELRKALT